MGNINIQSLFADIISTPEQREEKLLKEGMLQGQLLASGLKGRAAAISPLAQIAGQLGVQRQENLKRAVQPMLGIDARTTGEKLAEQLGQIDTSTPEGLMQAAQAIQSIDPVRAAALRQASVEATRAEEERELRLKGERQRQELAQNREERAIAAAEQDNELFGLNRDLTTIRLSKARQDALDAMEYKGNVSEFANEVEQLGFATQASGLRRRLLDPQNVMSNIAAQMRARLEASQLSDFEPIVGNKADQFIELAQSRKFFEDAMSTGFWKSKPEKSRAEILDMAARVKQLNPSASDGEILDTVEVLIKTGAGQGLNDVSDSDIEQMAQEQAESRDNYDPEASAAIAAAQLGESPSSQAPPQQISKEDAQSLGYVPQGYTEMTSGLLQLTGDTSEDWAGGQFVDKQAQQQLQQEIEAEYLRINPTRKYSASAMTRARQNVMARNK